MSSTFIVYSPLLLKLSEKNVASTDATATALGCTLELRGKTLLLDTSHILDAGIEKLKTELEASSSLASF